MVLRLLGSIDTPLFLYHFIGGIYFSDLFSCSILSSVVRKVCVCWGGGWQ